jgi:hypothetical protein
LYGNPLSMLGALELLVGFFMEFKFCYWCCCDV